MIWAMLRVNYNRPTYLRKFSTSINYNLATKTTSPTWRCAFPLIDMPFFVCLLIIWKIYSVRFTSLPEYIPIQERILQPDSLQNLLTQTDHICVPPGCLYLWMWITPQYIHANTTECRKSKRREWIGARGYCSEHACSALIVMVALSNVTGPYIRTCDSYLSSSVLTDVFPGTWFKHLIIDEAIKF